MRLRRKTERRLDEYNQPTANFFVLTGLAAAIATLGLILDNVAIIIGAMVVAPLVTPIFGFSLSLLILRLKRMVISVFLILLGTILAVAISALVGMLVIFAVGDLFDTTQEIISRTDPNLLYFLVSLFSGVAGAYAYSRPKVLESITGIAISVAIIPPLAVMGIGISVHDWALVQQSFLLYIFNLVGIVFGSVLTFFVLGFGGEKK